MSAILAKILNSTVGTSTITPLDTLLATVGNNSADRLYNKLKTDVKLVGADEVLYNYDGTWANNGTSGSFSSYKMSSFMSFSQSGTVLLKTTQTGTRTDAAHTFRLFVYDSANTQLANGQMSIPNGATAELSVALNVVAGTKYKITLEAYSSTPSQNLRVCAKPVLFSATTTLSTT